MSYIDEKQISEVVAGERPSAEFRDHVQGRQFSTAGDNAPMIHEDTNKLHRDLKGRHMQMIAIGGAIGAGLFVGSGGPLATGGPGSLLLAFMIVGAMMLFVMQALAELAVMYPVNGAFYTYIVRFMDPSWGFAMGWDYAIQWLTILPFEITAASLTIDYWTNGSINVAAWITLFLVVLSVIQVFGVKGYGETEFILSMLKILGCTGFIILGIIIDCGGVPTDDRGYIGARYWHNPGAFLNGFKGFCSVFVTASFAFGGTELTGLAAAEADNPRKQIPKATRQVFWRIAFFYVVNIFMVGLLVPANNPNLLDASDSNTKDSAFVLAIKLANIQVLPSIFNAIITISVISVANSATYGSTRTLQALATRGMAPKFLAYVDRSGRPIPTVVIQLLFGLLAFVNEASKGSVFFTWLLSLSGLANFFVWGSICISHVRFRRAWQYQGHSLEELPYRAAFGTIGSYIGAALNFLCLAASFYYSLFPIGVKPNAQTFFEGMLAAPLILGLYIIWKVYSFIYVPEHRPMYIKIKNIDVYTGMREGQLAVSGPEATEEKRREFIEELREERQKSFMDRVKTTVTSLF